ncbi:MAG: hypothetical protein IJI05_00005, partial [Erysipelotrichaceae bacterium]|nr:hypothetical protein [Erysipelotrichaceae bacterium]
QSHGTYVKGGVKPDGSEQIIPFTAQVEEGTSVVLAARPESVIFNAADNSVSGKVNEMYSSGKDWLINFDLGSNNLRGYCDADFNVEIGSQIPIAFRQKGVFLFNEETGSRY